MSGVFVSAAGRALVRPRASYPSASITACGRKLSSGVGRPNP